MEKEIIDIEHILAALRALQERVEHIIVEGVAVGWYRFDLIILLAIWQWR